ncbi:hypothetical protein C7K25_05980 [Gulosibacter molinativorax]|uniref:Uncharacterized protein n=1 Tax=Gulosibacter molinativorax TaxID=256821 RepID=A0ABT7C6U3_9MICO|nr:hypothetical protein [Gulosibacter molinativorax]
MSVQTLGVGVGVGLGVGVSVGVGVGVSVATGGADVPAASAAVGGGVSWEFPPRTPPMMALTSHQISAITMISPSNAMSRRRR